jgi:hypothetical protein
MKALGPITVSDSQVGKTAAIFGLTLHSSSSNSSSIN